MTVRTRRLLERLFLGALSLLYLATFCLLAMWQAMVQVAWGPMEPALGWVWLSLAPLGLSFGLLAVWPQRGAARDRAPV